MAVSWSRVLFFIVFGVFFTETLDAPGRVHELLLTGKKRVALRTNFNGNVLFGGSNFQRIAAGTFDGRHGVLRMNIRFHCYFNPLYQLSVHGF